jgi:hypothetical protein
VDEVDVDEAPVLRKPAAVHVATYLLVFPVLFGWPAAITAWQSHPAFGATALACEVVALVGFVSLALNVPAAQWSASVGAIGLAIMNVAFSPFGLLIAALCLPVAILVLLPARSRAWFAA